MRNICLNKNSLFVSVDQLNPKITLFKEGCTNENNALKKVLVGILQKERDVIKMAVYKYQTIFVLLLEGVVQKVLMQNEELIKQELTQFEKCNSQIPITSPRQIRLKNVDTGYEMIETKFLQLVRDFNRFSKVPIYSPGKQNQYQQIALDNLNIAFGQLTVIAQQAFLGNNQITKTMKALHLYIIRRFQQVFFLQNLMSQQKMQENVMFINQFIDKQIYPTIKQLFLFYNSKQMIKIKECENKLAYSLLEMNFKDHFQHGNSQLKKLQLISTFQNIKQICTAGIIEPIREKQEINSQIIDKRINQVNIYHILQTNPKPEDIKKHVSNLLRYYDKCPTQQTKYLIVVNIAEQLAKKEPKNAVPLFLHLQIYEEAIKLVDSMGNISHKQPQNNDLMVKWYLQIAYFKQKQRYNYFERCIEKVKSQCFKNFSKMTELQQLLQKQLQQISKGQKVTKQLWDWEQIKSEVQFLKAIYQIDPRYEYKKQNVIAISLRQ